MKYTMRFAVLALSLCLGSPASVLADEKCKIYDSDDNGANIRSTPNGRKINKLRNGRTVYIQKVRNDSKDRPWAYVSGPYKGDWRNWGWVYMDLLRC